MAYQFYILNNGIKIVHREAKGNISHCGLMVNTGSRDELEHESGMAHFIEHMIFKGTRKRKAYHVLSRIENVGGDLNAFTSKEETCVYASFLSQYYDQSLELFADVAFNSIFPEKEIVKEKDVIVDEINSYNDNPSELIFDEFEDLVFKGHPIGRNILGDAESVNKLNRNDIFRFIKRNYSTHQMVIASVGNIDFNRLVRMVEKYFGHIKSSHTRIQRIAFKAYKKKLKIEKKDSYLTHAILGNIAYSRQEPKRLPLGLLTNLLGGPALNSRLNLSIREKYGYAYSIEASYQPYSDTGLFMVYVGSDKKYIDHSLKLVKKELKKLQDTKLGTIQLHRAKQQIIGQLALSFESGLSEMLGIAKNHLNNSPVKSLNRIIESIEKINAEELQAVSNEIFKRDDLSTLIYKARDSQ